MAEYTKLSALVDSTFTVEKSYGFKYKLWDREKGAMLVSEKYLHGYRKVYTLLTDKGYLDLGAGQLGNLLETIYKDGVANLYGSTFQVKSNGKTGMDTRYYFNHQVEKQSEPDEVHTVTDNEQINLDDIPF